jgi:hypothetical protein
MDDDGNVSIRTRLIRPMARETMTVEHFERSNWRKATREEFSPLWEAECVRIPEFSESAFHVITGLLLPSLGPAADREYARLPLRDR